MWEHTEIKQIILSRIGVEKTEEGRLEVLLLALEYCSQIAADENLHDLKADIRKVIARHE